MMRVISLLFTGIFMTSLQAASHTITLPSVVGPNLYELYTDAKMFITHVTINGHKIKLSNAEGVGMSMGNGYRLNGPMGYPNKVVINGFLKPGENHINVVFEPSRTINQAKEQGALELVSKEIFTRAVLARGSLSKETLSIDSDELDLLIQNRSSDVDVLLDKKKTNFDEKFTSSDNQIDYRFELPSHERVATATIKDCEIDINTSGNLVGKLFLNDGLISTINKNSRRAEGTLQALLSQGKNRLRFDSQEHPLADESHAKKNYLEVLLSCRLDSLVEEVKFPEALSRMRFGDYSNVYKIPLMWVEVDEKKDYSADFDISL